MPRIVKAIAFLLFGFGLRAVARTFEFRADLASLEEKGAGLAGHSTALLFTLASIGCFIYAVVVLFRRNPRPPKTPVTDGRASPLGEDEPGTTFDADAALARYLARRENGALEPHPTSPPAAAAMPVVSRPAAGFGRKKV